MNTKSQLPSQKIRLTADLISPSLKDHNREFTMIITNGFQISEEYRRHMFQENMLLPFTTGVITNSGRDYLESLKKYEIDVSSELPKSDILTRVHTQQNLFDQHYYAPYRKRAYRIIKNASGGQSKKNHILTIDTSTIPEIKENMSFGNFNIGEYQSDFEISVRIHKYPREYLLRVRNYDNALVVYLQDKGYLWVNKQNYSKIEEGCGLIPAEPEEVRYLLGLIQSLAP